MSQENVDRHLRSIEVWNSGAFEGWLSLAAAEPHSEFRTSGVFPGVARVHRGVDGMRQLWSDMRAPWEKFHVSIERIEELGDAVLSLFTFEVAGREGLRASRQWAHVARYELGQPTITENYGSWDARPRRGARRAGGVADALGQRQAFTVMWADGMIARITANRDIDQARLTAE
jgi:hypothetical protein